MNNIEAMQKAFETCEIYAGRDFRKDALGYLVPSVNQEFRNFLCGYQAGLASQSQQEPADDVLTQIRKVRTTHSDDRAVDKFAEAMKEKLEVSRRVHGRGGWDNKGICTEERLQGLLLGHVAKGDPVDVGNFAMMLFNRGEKTQFPLEAQQTESKPVVWGYAWQCKSVGDWRIEKLGEGCIPPKDTLALYTLPPAPEGDKACEH